MRRVPSGARERSPPPMGGARAPRREGAMRGGEAPPRRSVDSVVKERTRGCAQAPGGPTKVGFRAESGCCFWARKSGSGFSYGNDGRLTGGNALGLMTCYSPRFEGGWLRQLRGRTCQLLRQAAVLRLQPAVYCSSSNRPCRSKPGATGGPDTGEVVRICSFGGRLRGRKDRGWGGDEQ